MQGLPNIAGTITGWYENTELDIFDAAQGDMAVALKLVPSTLAPTHFWTGPAYLDASINVTATGAVSISSTYVGAGDWTREPVVVLDALRERGERARTAPRPGGAAVNAGVGLPASSRRSAGRTTRPRRSTATP